VYLVVFYHGGPWQNAFLGTQAATVLWQLRRIAPYLPITSQPVDWARRPRHANTIRLLTSNVMQENDQYQRWLEVARAADPDVILALEVDDAWATALADLRDDYPHVVSQPQDNYYGLMLLSRLPLVDPEIRTLVEGDVPSVRAGVELRNGTEVQLYGVHPRPPEPIRDNHAAERDAEVVLLGQEIQSRSGTPPTIVAGDFNDVAWSHTTDLFIQLSGLLDPRRGRGIFNTFHAHWPLFRFPLDHVFHSNHFKLVDLRRLDEVGSDHFPVCVELQYERRAPEEQPEPEPSSKDVREAVEKVKRAEEEG
jgi:endonuclease/exonuclease/phosphatase (EEP) superfamily protein YafD